MLLASPAGCVGEDDEERPQRSRSAADARKCLKADGFDTRAHSVNTGTDRDAPDDVVYAIVEDAHAEIGFYDDLARAKQLEPGIRENAKRFDGAVKRIDRATIIWLTKAPLGARLRVEKCVAAP